MFRQLIFAFIVVSIVGQAELKISKGHGISYLINLLAGEYDIKPNENEASQKLTPLLQSSNGYSYLMDYLTFQDIRYTKGTNGKKIIKVNCRKGNGNGTVFLIKSAIELQTVLAVYGNSTKHHVEGNCAVILFYTVSCPSSALVAPHYNAMGRQFPDIQIAAIDAFKFTAFSYELGVLGVPTIMLFHQGKFISRFRETPTTVNSLVQFVTNYTGIKSAVKLPVVTSDDFNGPVSNKIEDSFDMTLLIAWLFIIICAIYYFFNSSYYQFIAEIIQSNWREAVEHLED